VLKNRNKNKQYFKRIQKPTENGFLSSQPGINTINLFVYSRMEWFYFLILYILLGRA